MARLVARQVGRLEAMAHRLESYHEARGYFTKAGEIKASVGREVEVVARLLDEARRLFEQLQARGPVQTGDVVYRCTIPGRPPRVAGSDLEIRQDTAPPAPSVAAALRSTPAASPDPAATEIEAPAPSTPAPAPAAVVPNPAATDEASGEPPDFAIDPETGAVMPALHRRTSWTH